MQNKLQPWMMQDHYLEKDFAPECSHPWMIWVYNWGQLGYTKWFDTEAECDEAFDRMVRGEDERYNESKRVVQTRWGTFRA
jgi:hypothetical protein